MRRNTFERDTIVKLGDIEFLGAEVPEQMPFGGKQTLVVHELVGGVRVIDAMGGFDAPLSWSGLFLGPNALARARQLDAMRRKGAPVELSWSEFKFVVVIETFDANFERFYQIPYRINCLPASNASSSALSGKVNLDSQVRADMGTVSTLSGAIGNSSLSGVVSKLSSAVSSVSDFAKATQGTINGVLQPLAAVQSQVKTLVASVGNTVANITTLGGIAPNNPIAQQAAKLTGQVASFTSLPQLYNLQSVLGRMGTNLQTASATGQTVSTAGGNLFQVAAKQFGDATAWPLLAKANGVTDPQVQGLKTLVIPPAPNGAAPVGGVLSG